MNIKSLILRFRDLTTFDDETIEKHSQIIDEHNKVFWGWWNKPDENVIDEIFRGLSKNPFDLYLLDSGQSKVFIAKCIGIYWDLHHKVINSPEPQMTPEYYNQMKCKAWFELGSIKQISTNYDEFLRDFSYVKVDKFLDTEVINDIYENKVVYSIRELLSQNRTLWFIRERVDGDDIHEVLLSKPSFVKPSHFTDLFTQKESNHLLWVSDLHYSDNYEGHVYHQYSQNRSQSTKDLIQFLHENMETHGIIDLAGLLISGDLTWKASWSEFSKAKEFIDWAISRYSIGSDEIIICPGNHDITYSIPEESHGEIGPASVKDRENYERFYSEVFNVRPNEYLSMGRKFLIKNSVPVEICSLNSQYLEQRRGSFRGHGFIGSDQLDDAAKNMGWDSTSANDPTAFRIVMLHHHILPITYRETPVEGGNYSIVLDAEALSRWVVKHNVKLVLHGHMHQPFVTKLTRPSYIDSQENIEQSEWHSYYVIGMGSTGVTLNHVGEIGTNTCGVLSFFKNKLSVKVFTVSNSTTSRLLFNVDIPYE